ncbi:MAG: hypothetical protein RL199_597 [Pseudomonadota bacterium]|jgi:predicted ATPase
MTPAPLLVFIGPHGAGKTTLGRLVAEQLGWVFQHELGRELREEALANDPNADATRSQAAFDREVCARELARDQASPFPRVVETWHPGNLAYARRRDSGVDEAAVRSAAGRVAIVQPLRIREETALARLSEPGPDAQTLLRFFREVGMEAERIAPEVACIVLPHLDTDDETPERLAEVIVTRVRNELVPVKPGRHGRDRRPARRRQNPSGPRSQMNARGT